MGDNLVFVTVTGAAPGEEARRPEVQDLVRRQALKAFHSARGSDLSEERQRESEAVGSSRRKHMHRFRLPKPQSTSSDKAVVPQAPPPPPPPIEIRLPRPLSPFEPMITSLGPAKELLAYCTFTLVRSRKCVA